MSWIVMIDLRENNGHLINIVDENDNIAQYPTKKEAAEAAKRNELTEYYPAYLINVDEDDIVYL